MSLESLASTMLFVCAAASSAIWWIVLLAPWRPWGTGERLDVDSAGTTSALDASDVTILIPARNEAETIARTLDALLAQSVAPGTLDIVVVEDRSDDGTDDVLARYVGRGVRVVAGAPRPAGWSGKLWALEQGKAAVSRPLTLLLDADIELAPGALAALLAQRSRSGAALVSVMAHLRMVSVWERWLMPAFVYFFKLLYPFRLANDPRVKLVAAAAGGCVLLETRLFEQVGLFGSIREALIDDCTLARQIKRSGERTWLGLARDVRSHRRYDDLGSIWNMVARTAFTQLNRSALWLGVCTLLMGLAFVAPFVALAVGGRITQLLGGAAWLALTISYVPTLRYYGRSWLAAPLLPLVGALYLAMTWDSAVRHWRGRTATWRGRTYDTPTT